LAAFSTLLYYSGVMKMSTVAAVESLPPNPINIEAVRKIVDAKQQDPFFKRRHERNVKNPPLLFSRDQFWRQMIVCICTSVQKSGPKSRVSKFVREEPFQLRLAVCVGHENLRLFAEEILRSRGLRFGRKLAQQIEANMGWLKGGGWATVEEQFNKLVSFSGYSAYPQQRITAETTSGANRYGPERWIGWLWSQTGSESMAVPRSHAV
jgi:hypothetical protein